MVERSQHHRNFQSIVHSNAQGLGVSRASMEFDKI
jgi:hypothetical protein